MYFPKLKYRSLCYKVTLLSNEYNIYSGQSTLLLPASGLHALCNSFYKTNDNQFVTNMAMVHASLKSNAKQWDCTLTCMLYGLIDSVRSPLFSLRNYVLLGFSPFFYEILKNSFDFNWNSYISFNLFIFYSFLFIFLSLLFYHYCRILIVALWISESNLNTKIPTGSVHSK